MTPRNGKTSRLPNCFIVGAPKSGTTSLYHYLDQHPEVYMCAIKEPNFFATEIRLENFDPALRDSVARDARSLQEFLAGPMHEKRFGGIVSEWTDYVRLFANAANEKILGEASVCYMWSPTAAERIVNKIPDAKILVMLRHPADRAFSDYQQGVGNGIIRWSFREHIERNLRHRSAQFCVHYPFLELGLYSEQLQRYLARFGTNVWVGMYDDFRNRPLDVMQQICRFLGVDSGFPYDVSRRHLEAQVPRSPAAGWLKRTGIWRTAAHLTPRGLRPIIRRSLVKPSGSVQMDPADRRYLLDFYREDVRKLAALLDRDLDGWLKSHDILSETSP